jgi:membrane associated rhomboid family serine protease
MGMTAAGESAILDTMETSDDMGDAGESSWLSIPKDPGGGKDAADLSPAETRRWGQVLAARRIPCRSVQTAGGFRLLVPPALYAAALEELRLFEEENRNWPPPEPPTKGRGESPLAPLSVLILLATFHNLTLLDLHLFGFSSPDWAALGNAHAGQILAGQWWRLLTALTLHADWIHLLGNLALGAPFVILLCRDLGSGLSWTLILASGALGNLANALLQLPDHRAVGASTAVFGAIGLIAALSLMRQRHQRSRRPLLPVAAALALLALLGTGGEGTDLGAHLFGFASGFSLGLLSVLPLARRGRPGPWGNRLLALASALAILCSWGGALLQR